MAGYDFKFLQIKEMFSDSYWVCSLFQDSEKLQGLFQAALELSSSTKPYDCVTASYLLNFLIWQDALPSSLSAYLKTQQAACGAEDKSAIVVERNTLMGLYWINVLLLLLIKTSILLSLYSFS